MDKEKKGKHFIKKPIYKGGMKAIRAFIQSALQYPSEALEKKVEGTVLVRYEIDHRGNVVDAKVISGIGHGCDEEAMRIARLLKFDVPRTRGVRVRFHKDIYIHFRLPKTPPPPPPLSYSYQITPTAEKKQDSDSGYSYTITL